MKTNRLLWAIGALCLIMASCDKEPEPVPVEPKWEPSTTSLTFKFGQTQSVSMTAENIDFVNLVSAPKDWTVSPVVKSIDIKAPSGDNDFDLSGTVEVEGVNRETEKKVNVKISVSVDPNSLEAKIEVTSDVVYTQVFSLSETKSFDFTSSHVKDIKVEAPAGWAAAIDGSAVKVTAPAAFSGAAISGAVTISGTPVAGSSTPSATFTVGLPAYKIDASELGDGKLFTISDEDGNGLGLLALQMADLETSVLNAYMVCDGAYTDAIAVDGDALYVGYDGTILAADAGEFLGTTLAQVTVTDIDENTYGTVFAFGNIWMDSNLKTTKYADGTEIAGTFYPAGDASTVAEYGLLYQRAAAYNGKTAEEAPFQGVCPDGWHAPVITEFSTEEGIAAGADANPDPTLVTSLGAKRAGMCINAYGMTLPQGKDVNAFYFCAGYNVLMSIQNPATANMLMLQAMPPTQDGMQYVSVRCVKDSLPFVD